MENFKKNIDGFFPRENHSVPDSIALLYLINDKPFYILLLNGNHTIIFGRTTLFYKKTKNDRRYY